MTLDRGFLLAGRYRIVEILGQGGMGAVYKAVDENLGVDVALKENLFTSDEYIRQFRREAVILASMRHTNLPRVSDHFEIENQGQYLVMDYIEGEDLRERMDRAGILPDEEVIVLGAAICDALGYLHSRQSPVLHRDIKPGNIKITPEGDVSLVDFGLAKIVQGSQATTTGARAMTPGYSSPEQYGTARTDSRSDIYSLGATLYAAVTIAIPEDGLARAMDQAELTPVRDRNSKVSRRLANVIEKSLEVHPDDRYQTAEEFREALLAASGATRRRVEGGDLTIPPPPDIEDREDGEIAPPEELKDAVGGVATPVTPSLPVTISRPRKDREQRARRRLILSFFIIVIVIGSGAYLLGTGTLQEMLGWVTPSATPTEIPAANPPTGDPATFAPTEVVGALITETEEILPNLTLTIEFTFTPTLTFTPTETATLEVTPTLGESPTDTLTPEITSTPTITETPTVTPTPLLTPIGGGTGQIAFVSDRTRDGVPNPQIWLVNVNGTGLVQVTDNPDGACQPDWSPDGSQLAFISPCEEIEEFHRDANIYIINADGTDLVSLPTGLGTYDPAWSPDGDRIAFTYRYDDNHTEIRVLYLLDNSIQTLTDDDTLNQQPAWSPDSTRIAFVSLRGTGYRIWMMSDTGNDPEMLTYSGAKVDSYPVWSPDGEFIYFTQRGESVPYLMGQRVDTPVEERPNAQFRITSGGIPERDGDFSGDGAWLVYEGWPDGENHDIYVMTSDGGDRTRLTTNATLDFDPVWRP